MPLLDTPIYEAMKPSFKSAVFLDTKVPANIVPILDLLQARAVAFDIGLPMGLRRWIRDVSIRSESHFSLRFER